MSDTLTHYGIKGMKWGVRRFQNKDGSLTPAGRKRYGEDDVADSTKKETKVSGDYKKARRSISEMTDEELMTAVRRLETEKRYRDLNPEKVSLGKKFVDSVLIPAAKGAGTAAWKNYIEKPLKNYLGLDKDGDVDKLKKAVERLRLQKELDDLKKNAVLKNDVERARLEKKLRDYQNGTASDKDEKDDKDK